MAALAQDRLLSQIFSADSNKTRIPTGVAFVVGWCKTVTEVQNKLKDGKLVLGKPALVLSTEADEVLSHQDIDDFSQNLGPPLGATAAQRAVAPIVRRRIGTDALESSAHDVLAAPSAVRVDEAMRHVENWLATHFPGG